MKKIYSILIALAFCQLSISQGLISSTLIAEATAAEMITLGFPGAEYDVKVYKIIYTTYDAHENATIASGAVAVPQVNCSLPILVYCHGTVFLKSDVPSNFNGEGLLGAGMASYGYVTILPDYLGLGVSPGMHPYIHSATEGRASFHMIRATEQFCLNNSISLNSQLFVTGYSQGGHASMALVKYIEEYLLDDFTLNLLAAVCGSGPYDISGTQTDMILANAPYSSGAYLPYVMFAYQSVYDDLFQSPDEVLLAPYDANLPPLFDGLHGGGEIQSNMPAIPNNILIPAVLDELNAGTHAMNTALEDNDLFDWSPTTPIRMTYCTGDEQVAFMNSLVAEASMMNNGATDATAVMLGTGNHGACFQPYALYLFDWFGDLKEDCITSVETIHSQPEINIYPNPASEKIVVSINNQNRFGNGEIILYDSSGKTVMRKRIIKGAKEVVLDTKDLNTGSYHLTIGSEKDIYHKQVIIK